MHILLTGATGFIGRHLAPHLVGTGHRVTILRRGVAAAAPGDWAGPPDLSELDDWPDWPAGVEAVVHLAAVNPEHARHGGDNAALHLANVEGTAALARRSVREGVGRIVFLSSANVHAPRRDGGVISETEPLHPQSAYAASKIAAEAALRAALADTGTEFCILRPVPVFGPGGRGTVARITRLAATPWPLPLKGLGGPRSLLAVGDLVRAIALALTVPKAAGETLLLAGGSATPANLVAALRHRCGRPSRLVPVPTAVFGALARLLGKRRAWDSVTGSFVVDAGRARKILGWSATIEWPDGVSEASNQR